MGSATRTVFDVEPLSPDVEPLSLGVVKTRSLAVAIGS